MSERNLNVQGAMSQQGIPASNQANAGSEDIFPGEGGKTKNHLQRIHNLGILENHGNLGHGVGHNGAILDN